jgi:hypothetical protein
LNILKERAVEEVRKARTDLIDINKTALTGFILVNWYQQNQPLWQRTQQHIPVGYPRNPANDIPLFLQGYQQSTDIELLEEVRANIIGCLDKLLSALESNNVSRSLLQERTSRVRDIQLATLLNEFQAAKDVAPNIAAIGFRTILMLTIQQQAKRVAPNSALATNQDLKLSRVINDAIDDNIFSSGNTERLRTFRSSQQKANFNIIAHKVGPDALVDRASLEDAIDLLNNLLAEII